MVQIQSGALAPGAPIKDVEIAAEFGVSRTPVREAVQLLRDAGVLEISASRFTRVAASTPERTRQASNVWFPLHSMVLRQLVAGGPLDARTVAELERAHEATEQARDRSSLAAYYTASARFYDILVAHIDNPPLQRATAAVMHAFRLGLASLASPPDLAAAALSQRLTIDALRDGDPELASRALETLRSIVIPVDVDADAAAI